MDDGPEVGVLDVLKAQDHFFPIRYYRANRRNPPESASSGTKVLFYNSASLTNFAVEHASGKYIVRSDPEMIIPKNGIEDYYNALLDDDRYYTCGARYMTKEPSGDFIRENYKDPEELFKYIKANGVYDCGFLTTMGISKDSFKRIGGLRTGGSGWGGNDFGFSLDCTKVNFKGTALKSFTTTHMFHRRANHYVGAKNCAVTNPTMVEISGDYVEEEKLIPMSPLPMDTSWLEREKNHITKG